MKRNLILITILLAICLPCFAGQYSSVPVDNEAYRVIDWAANRGIIPVQSDVKPYNLDRILALLGEIYESPVLKDSQKTQIELIVSDLNRSFGVKDSHSVMQLLHDGYYGKNYDAVSLKFGGKAYSTQTFGIASDDNTLAWDSRNGASVFVSGDVLNTFSFDLNVFVDADKLGPSAFLDTDFKMSSDGFYMTEHDELTSVLKNNNLIMGYYSKPEISTTAFKNTLTARFASIERDWGYGHNNVQLSSTAGTINGVDLDWKPTDWFSYSVMMGSLGKMTLGNGGTKTTYPHGTVYSKHGQVLWPCDVLQEDFYDNNISTHKAEVTFFKNFKMAVWESLVYRNRFEIRYLNPVAIYMFEQNNCGDFDNVLAGFDFSFRVKNFGTFYASAAMDEANSTSKFFKNPRNIFAYQAGVKMAVNDGGFGEVTLQATYVPAFFGSHYGYPNDVNPWGREGYKTTYVNAGKNVGYPINPDTLELLAEYSSTINSSINASVLGRVQLRSAQYATHKTGTNILDTMVYSKSSQYADRDFFHNIWDTTMALDFNVEKTFQQFPISLVCGMQFILDRYRDFTPSVLADDVYDYDKHNLGSVTFDSDWKTSFNVNGSIGVKIYY